MSQQISEHIYLSYAQLSSQMSLSVIQKTDILRPQTSEEICGHIYALELPEHIGFCDQKFFFVVISFTKHVFTIEQQKKYNTPEMI